MINWNKEVTDRLVELVSAPENYSEYSIANMLSEEFELSISRSAVNNKVRALKDSGDLVELLDKPRTELMPYYYKYADAYEEDIFPEKTFKLNPNQWSITIDKKYLKILYLGDLHMPFEVESQVQTAINRNATADVCVCAEISDFYAISRFNKSMSVPLEIEIDRIVRFYEYVNSKFSKVFIINGNHGERVNRQVTGNLPSSLNMLIKTTNMLKFLARPFPNINVVDGWFFQINDLFCGHAETFSKIDMRSGVNVYNWLTEWTGVFDFNPVRFIVQGHVHQLGVSYRNDVKIVEAGCLSYIPDYSVEKFYGRPQVNGYVVVIQNDGLSDLNLSREYMFETPKYVPQIALTMEGR